MFKSIGLGICCLTLSISGVTRATPISVDCGKFGDDKCIKVPTDTNLPPGLQFILDLLGKDGIKSCDKVSCTDDNKDCHIVLPLCLDDKDTCKNPCDLKLKPVIDCDDHKLDCNDGKDGHDCEVTCKLDICDKHEPVLCDIGNKDCKSHDGCDLVIDCGDHGPSLCDFGGCDSHDNCVPCVPCDHDPAAVPAPASAAFGGLGVAGIMLMAGLRSRRTAAV